MEDDKEVINVRIVKDEPELTVADILKHPIIIAVGTVIVTKLTTRWMDRALEKIDTAKQAQLDAENAETTTETTAPEA